jgi:hypothetical protein
VFKIGGLTSVFLLQPRPDWYVNLFGSASVVGSAYSCCVAKCNGFVAP